MTSNPNSNIPAAFGGHALPPRGPSFFGMHDAEVLKIASNSLRLVQTLPFGSAARESQWHDFEAAMGELARRAVDHTLRKIYEMHESEHRQQPGQDDGR